MARKRKTRASEASQEAEPVQVVEPEPEPQTEPEPEPEPAVEPQTEPEPQTVEEDTAAGEEAEELMEEDVVEEVVEEEVVEEEVVEEVEEQEEEGKEEQKIETLPEVEKEQEEGDNTEKPSEIDEIAVTNGDEQVEVKKEGDAKKEEVAEDEELEEEPLEKILEPFTKDQLTILIKEAVAKHPEILVNVHGMADADPAHRKIFVHGLGWEATDETLTSAFGKYGDIEDCKLVVDRATGKSKGYGFILFKHREGARRALNKPQKNIDGRVTSCQLASAGPVQAPPPTVVASVSTPPASEYTQRKIFVSNVSADLDPKKLLEFFSTFGEIEEGPLGLDRVTGKPRGFCLFVYKSVEGAKKALEEPHKTFESATLNVQKAVDGPKHNKGGYFQQQQQQQQHGHTSMHHQQHHHHGRQNYNHHPAKKGRYSGNSGGGHLMAPSGGSGMHSGGYPPQVPPAAIGQAVAALLATQGAGLGIGNLLGGPQGVPPYNAGFGGPGGAGGYGQPGMQGGYGQQQMGQGGVRPHQGGPPYMGHGR